MSNDSEQFSVSGIASCTDEWPRVKEASVFPTIISQRQEYINDKVRFTGIDQTPGIPTDDKNWTGDKGKEGPMQLLNSLGLWWSEVLKEMHSWLCWSQGCFAKSYLKHSRRHYCLSWVGGAGGGIYRRNSWAGFNLLSYAFATSCCTHPSCLESNEINFRSQTWIFRDVLPLLLVEVFFTSLLSLEFSAINRPDDVTG